MLDGGYFFPERDTYPNGSQLTYACDKGRMPSVEGWWASSTCENGTWVREPQCIGECLMNTFTGSVGGCFEI